MLGIVALVAALIAVGTALYRLSAGAPPALRTVQLVAALVAGVLGILWWHGTGDSRWLVGGVLLIGAAVPGHVAGKRRGVAIAALILLVLGVALYGIAVTRPMAPQLVLSRAAT
ncbi:hypothetical protein M9980_12900 [Sphingomonas donggukensis]|uniref:Uncharacterized protein n=1 Tax=Sphingomonas donggukensis TaxID=2949093 RepID=A0ABY4TV99_9SPHN|nr:hypothetical protein [Sphingomonas donggukensis]URW75417.1 hypothetical protein M9980_12900 [Sphingomonas donggukensis]